MGVFSGFPEAAPQQQHTSPAAAPVPCPEVSTTLSIPTITAEGSHSEGCGAPQTVFIAACLVLQCREQAERRNPPPSLEMAEQKQCLKEGWRLLYNWPEVHNLLEVNMQQVRICTPTNWKVPEHLQFYLKSSNVCCHHIRASPLSQAAVIPFFGLFIYLPTRLEQMSFSCSSWAAKLEDSGSK